MITPVRRGRKMMTQAPNPPQQFWHHPFLIATKRGTRKATGRNGKVTLLVRIPRRCPRSNGYMMTSPPPRRPHPPPAAVVLLQPAVDAAAAGPDGRRRRARCR